MLLLCNFNTPSLPDRLLEARLSALSRPRAGHKSDGVGEHTNVNHRTIEMIAINRVYTPSVWSTEACDPLPIGMPQLHISREDVYC